MTIRKNISNFIFSCLLLLTLASAIDTAMGDAPGDVLYERTESSSAEVDSAAEMSSFPPAVFPHWIHRINYRCDACHDSLFEMKRGGTPVTMALMAEGKVCGACHNKTLAFGSDFQSCDRCHVEPEE